MCDNEHIERKALRRDQGVQKPFIPRRLPRPPPGQKVRLVLPHTLAGFIGDGLPKCLHCLVRVKVRPQIAACQASECGLPVGQQGVFPHRAERGS